MFRVRVHASVGIRVFDCHGSAFEPYAFTILPDLVR